VVLYGKISRELTFENVCQTPIRFANSVAVNALQQLPKYQQQREEVVQQVDVLQCVAVCCSVLQCGSVWCNVVECVAVNVLQELPQHQQQREKLVQQVDVLQCVAVWCSVLQCGAV